MTEQVHGTPVLFCPPDGKQLGTEQDALDLIGDTWHGRAELVAVPVERLAAEFFQLDTRVAGEFTGKFANYGLRLAVLGDVSPYTGQSEAFADYVREANRGKQVWFLPDREALAARLGEVR